RRCQALAVRLAPYPALSAQRVAAELERLLAEDRPEAVLRRLGRAGVLRLLDPRYRFTRAAEARLARLADTLRWTAHAGLAAPPLELAGLALVADQPRAVAAAALARLALSGEPLARTLRALDEAPELCARLAAARARSGAARLLRGRSATELAWARLAGTGEAAACVEWFAGPGRRTAPSLRGDDVLALGVARGPDVTRVLAALRDARVDGKITDRQGEIDYVRRWRSGAHAGHGPRAPEEG
ncbi:MAG TPA: hypothetical protein VFX28_11740, partial [Methylomirabilota bacterium]|nr:hypothetical protein [Methylomirabilota bacterium]